MQASMLSAFSPSGGAPQEGEPPQKPEKPEKPARPESGRRRG